MLGDDARGVGSIWGRSGKKLESAEIFRKELDEMRAEHVNLKALCRVLDKDLATVEAAVVNLTKVVENLTRRMNIVEPQEQEDFNKLRFLESRINKLEAQMKGAV
jgi:chromosome segregation ATPase